MTVPVPGAGPAELRHQRQVIGSDQRFAVADKFRLLDLQGDGEIAYMRAAWSISLTPPGTSQPVSDSGKILVVLRKQADGSWLRVADAWNSDLAPAR